MKRSTRKRGAVGRPARPRQPRSRQLDIAAIPGLAAIFWPSFLEHDGLIFRREPGQGPLSEPIARDARLGMDNTAIEASASHTHVLDLFRHDRRVWRARSSTFDHRHPHFRLAERLGRLMAECWFAKLRRDFPRAHFRVYYARDDNPVVRFHRIHPGEPVWMSDPPPGTSAEEVMVLDSRRSSRTSPRTRPRKRAGRRSRSPGGLRRPTDV